MFDRVSRQPSAFLYAFNPRYKLAFVANKGWASVLGQVRPPRVGSLRRRRSVWCLWRRRSAARHSTTGGQHSGCLWATHGSLRVCQRACCSIGGWPLTSAGTAAAQALPSPPRPRARLQATPLHPHPQHTALPTHPRLARRPLPAAPSVPPRPSARPRPAAARSWRQCPRPPRPAAAARSSGSATTCAFATTRRSRQRRPRLRAARWRRCCLCTFSTRGSSRRRPGAT